MPPDTFKTDGRVSALVGHRIVVADDEQHVLAAMSQLLESAGHVVVGRALSGEEAVWLNQTLSPDIVILDVQMPGMDGLEAAQRMMAACPVPIVICSAHYDDDLMNKAANVGVYAYVVKPCRLADLLPAVNVAVSRFEDAKLLKGEVDTLRENLTTRKLVEQAKGIVMRTRNLSEDEAHRFLQQESQRQSKPLADLAKAIILAEKSFSPKIYGGKTALAAPL